MGITDALHRPCDLLVAVTWPSLIWSNCTLFLGLRNVSVERSATLLFHAGHDRQRNIHAGSTQRMLSAYNPKLRKYLIDNHYMETLEFHTIPGSTIIDRFGYRECPRQ